MTAAASPGRTLLGILRDATLIGADPPLRGGPARWPEPPPAPRPVPRGWWATRVDDLRAALPHGFVERDRTVGPAGSVVSFHRTGLDQAGSPLVLVRSSLRPAQPIAAEGNQLDARFTRQLGAPAVVPLHAVEVPRSPRAVMGAWEWSRAGLPTRSTVALLDGQDGERYTVQLNGAVEHLPDDLVDQFYAALSIGLLNTAW